MTCSLNLISTIRAFSFPLFLSIAMTGGLGAEESYRDRNWLQQQGQLLFEDRFDRQVSGNGAEAIGRGWNSATADRVPHLRQAEIEDGILKIDSATKEAGHAAHIHHPAGFRDGGVHLKFRFPGLKADESLTLGFVDREEKSVHAGHLCYAHLSPGRVSLQDRKTGVMNLEIRAQRQQATKQKKPLPAELEALLLSTEKHQAWQADQEWHDLTLVTEGDEMRLSIDGRELLRHRSAGFAHPVKRWFSFLVPQTVWIKEVQIYRVTE
jgi:hypothetical protein